MESEFTAFPVENKELFSNGLNNNRTNYWRRRTSWNTYFVKVKEQFHDDDLILAEYGATVVGMEILREKAEEIEEEARSKAVVQMAINSLSYSELEAIEHIFEELNGN